MGDLLDLDESGQYEKRAEVAAPNTVPTHVAIDGRVFMLRGSTYDLKNILDTIGVSGLGIAGAVNPGVVAYWQKFDDMGFAVAGANHLSRTYANGVLIPRMVSCDHQGDAKLTFELHIFGDGTNAPVTLSATASLPYSAAAPSATISIREMAMVGSNRFTLASAIRLPSTSTSVERGPRPRRSMLVERDEVP
jgi:hypothetical protein